MRCVPLLAAMAFLAPPLVAMQARFPDTDSLNAIIHDATQLNPKTVMPPYGRHRILSAGEIGDIVAFLKTL